MLTASRVRDLAAHTGDPAVASVYLDVDGRHRPVWADCVTAFDHLADQLVRRAAQRGDLSLSRSVDGDVARMRAWLQAGVDRERTRGVALFACAEQDYFEAVEVPAPLRDDAGVGAVPRVGPLVALLDGRRRALVALVDRRRLRVLRSELGEVSEVLAAEDPEPRAVDTSVEVGSFERHDGEAAEVHYRRAAGLVEQACRDAAPDHVLVAGPDDAVAGLTRHLPPPVAATVAGRLHLATTAGPAEVAAAVDGIEDAVDRARRAAVVEQLMARAGADDGGVLGIEHVLHALAAGKVGTLVVADGFGVAGSSCPSCGALHAGAAGGPCPVCGAELVACDDVVAAAVARSVAANASVVVCPAGELDAAAGGIGALERW